MWQALSRPPEMATPRGVVFFGGFGMMLVLLLLALLAPRAHASSIKPAIALFLVTAALGAHFMGSYGVVIDSAMLINMLQTNAHEVRDLLSMRMLASVLILAGVPRLVLWRLPVRQLNFAAQLWRNALALTLSLLLIALIALLALASFAGLLATRRNHKQLRFLINPLNSFYALGVLGFEANSRTIGPPLAIGPDARALPRSSKPPLFVLVVGEAARADHFALNGYRRPTNPELARHDLVSFSNASSCGTSTAASLPCMFSHLGRERHVSRDRDHENLLDVVQRAGLAVLWLDNQAGCNGLCDWVPHSFAHLPETGAPPLPYGLCDSG